MSKIHKMLAFRSINDCIISSPDLRNQQSKIAAHENRVAKSWSNHLQTDCALADLVEMTLLNLV